MTQYVFVFDDTVTLRKAFVAMAASAGNDFAIKRIFRLGDIITFEVGG